MKVLLDVGILLDVLFKRPETFDSSVEVLRLISFDGIEGYVSAASVTDICYLTENRHSRRAAKDLIARLTGVIMIAELTSSDILEALSSPLPDFQDALLVCMAKRIGADCIVTRKPEAFTGSRVLALEPDEFIAVQNASNHCTM